MPKSGSSRPIKHFKQPATGPHHRPLPSTPPKSSNAVAAHAVRVASNPGKIHSKQH